MSVDKLWITFKCVDLYLTGSWRELYWQGTSWCSCFIVIVPFSLVGTAPTVPSCRRGFFLQHLHNDLCPGLFLVQAPDDVLLFDLPVIDIQHPL